MDMQKKEAAKRGYGGGSGMQSSYGGFGSSSMGGYSSVPKQQSGYSDQNYQASSTRYPGREERGAPSYNSPA